jgi:hypothetical protein
LLRPTFISLIERWSTILKQAMSVYVEGYPEAASTTGRGHDHENQEVNSAAGPHGCSTSRSPVENCSSSSEFQKPLLPLCKRKSSPPIPNPGSGPISKQTTPTSTPQNHPSNQMHKVCFSPYSPNTNTLSSVGSNYHSGVEGV